MAGRKLRMAIVGCGGMAGSHLRGYGRIHEAEPERFEIAALCEPVRELAEKFSAQIETFQGSAPRIYPEIGEMLAKETLDGVDICCPHAFHHTNAIAALDAGVNVMVEKPIGITIRTSKAIIAAAQKNGKTAATAENGRRGIR